MVVLTVAITITIFLALGFFCFKMVRIMGGYNEQRTAIEAAALAAATDMSNIVINDPNIGYVGLSDSAPNGSGTAAGDGYDMPVIGINSLLATVRLDMIIADKLGDAIMQQRAREDYANAMTAQQTLVAALQAAAANNGSGRDKNNNILNPTADAVAAYQQNIIRMTGASQTNLVTGSMKLTLGCVPNTATLTNSTTNTPIPQPLGVVYLSAAEQQNGFYLPYTDVPFTMAGGFAGDFVFASLNANTVLVDPLAFSTTCPGLANQALLIPSVVKCEADQSFVDQDQTGKSLNRTIHIAGAAQASCAFDPHANSGALTFSFPNGVPPEVTSPLFLFSDSNHVSNYSPCDIFAFASNGGDYPERSLAIPSTSNYWTGTNPRVTKPISLALYDWIRRAGCTVNLQALSTLFSTPITPTTQSQIYAFYFTPITNAGAPTTSITTQVINNVPTILSRRVSQNQWIAIAGAALKSTNGYYYDLQVRDNCYKPGTQNGGQHGGEPLGNQLPPSASSGGGSAGGVTSPALNIDQPAPSGGGNEYPYPNSPAGPRPTAIQMGQSVDIRFKATGYPWTLPPPAPVPL